MRHDERIERSGRPFQGRLALRGQAQRGGVLGCGFDPVEQEPRQIRPTDALTRARQHQAQREIACRGLGGRREKSRGVGESPFLISSLSVSRVRRPVLLWSLCPQEHA
ncbi:hypothetical protein D3C87_1041890 [compost metagenome]